MIVNRVSNFIGSLGVNSLGDVRKCRKVTKKIAKRLIKAARRNLDAIEDLL
ncbi:hypothetical protein [Sutcliffiella halmapala]|uniref:hypothetical protein n=1 Tax=Sutcliffiella halmapala TaxID=79882 RepID=UPI001475340A|nr:hypothetical protein [Sutcliffiella halmapala]